VVRIHVPSPAQEIVRMLAGVHYVPVDSFRFFDCTGTVSDTDIAGPVFLTNLLHRRYFSLFNVNERCRKAIARRAAVIAEFLQTERTYLYFLLEFPEAVAPFVESLKEETRVEVINALWNIQQVHLQMAEVLEEISADFFGRMESALKEWNLRRLLVYGPYRQCYDVLKPQLSGLSKTSKIARGFAASKFGNGQALESAFIVIVQRPPRIPLLLDTLRKATPAVHPDRAALEEVYKQAIDVVRELDKAAGISAGSGALNFVKSRLVDNGGTQ
jgi:hypothetical protein